MLIEKGRNHRKEKKATIEESIEICKKIYDKAMTLNVDKGIMTPKYLLYEVEKLNKDIIGNIPAVLNMLISVQEEIEKREEE